MEVPDLRRSKLPSLWDRGDPFPPKAGERDQRTKKGPCRKSSLLVSSGSKQKSTLEPACKGQTYHKHVMYLKKAVSLPRGIGMTNQAATEWFAADFPH